MMVASARQANMTSESVNDRESWIRVGVGKCRPAHTLAYEVWFLPTPASLKNFIKNPPPNQPPNFQSKINVETWRGNFT